MRDAWIIFCKEMRRFFTDPRMLLALFAPGLVIYLAYTVMGQFTGSIGQAKVYENTSFVVAYSSNSGVESGSNPRIVSTLQSYFTTENKGNTLQTETYTVSEFDSAKAKLLDGSYDALIVFSDNFEVNYTDQSKRLTNTLTMYYDGNREQSYYCYNLLVTVSDTAYMSYRLNVDTSGAPINPNISGGNYTMSQVMSYVFPMVLVSLLFSTIIAICPGSVAGEKERGTLAALLLTPTKRYSIALGKVMALSVAAASSGAVSFLGLALSFPSLMGQSASSVFTMWGPGQLVLLLLLIISALLLFLAAGLLVSCLCRTSKEANSYMAPAVIILMMLAIVPATTDLTAIGYAFVPVLNILSCMNMLVSGATDIVLYLVITILMNIVFFAGLIALCGRLFKSERFMLKN